MHRMKIGLVAAIVLLVFTAGVYTVVTRDLKESVVGEVETVVSRAERMHQSILRLEALDFPAVDRQRDIALENDVHRAAGVALLEDRLSLLEFIVAILVLEQLELDHVAP